jgi:hypothetical protein
VSKVTFLVEGAVAFLGVMTTDQGFEALLLLVHVFK